MPNALATAKDGPRHLPRLSIAGEPTGASSSLPDALLQLDGALLLHHTQIANIAAVLCILVNSCVDFCSQFMSVYY